jgi:HKD family nuclease
MYQRNTDVRYCTIAKLEQKAYIEFEVMNLDAHVGSISLTHPFGKSR